MQKSMLVAAFLLPLLVLIPFSAYAQTSSPTIAEPFVTGMTISNDGTEVYVTDANGITRLSLSSAFNINSATVHPRQAIDTNTVFGIQAVAISNDGSRIFLGTNTFREPEVVQVSVMADRSIAEPNNPPSCCDFTTNGMTISRDGTWLIIGGGSSGIQSYQLGTPFDISTGVTQHSSSPQPASFQGMSISNDGMSLFTLSGSMVRQYALGTPYVASSINTMPVDTFQIGISGFSARDMDFSSDGMNMYILDTNNDDVVYQYPLTAAFTLSMPDTTPPTVTLSSEDVDEGGVTDEDTITLIAEFNEPINAVTFTPSDVTVTGDAAHEVDRVQLLSELRYEIDIGHGDEDPNIAVSIAANKFDDLNGNTNTAASNTFRYGFQFDLPVDTTPPAVIRSIPDQTINEGQTLDSLKLNITSDTASPLFNVTQISIEGDIVPIFALNQSIAIMDLDPLSTNATDFPDGNPDLNGTAPGGGSVNDDNLQRSFRISSIEDLDEGDPRLDARFEEEERQIVAGVPFDELIDPYTIIHTIPDDFVDNNLAQSPPIRIAYTYVLENGDIFNGIFDMVVNRVDEAPEIILPLEVTYVFDPESPTRTINLADHFMDPGGDNIVYNVTNPNPGIAAVTITGDMLSIDPVSSGIVNARLCAESQATGIPNAATCVAITVLVRGIETTESGIFRDSSVNVNHDLLDADVVLNWNDFAINPTVAFNHIIITADNDDATGEIRINQTGRTRITELTSNGTAVTSIIFASNGSGSISYDPASVFSSPSDSVTFTAVLHGPAIDPSEGVITGEIIPLFHDTLTVNYIIVSSNTDAAPGELQIGLTFGPRHTSDRFAIPLNDLFEDPDNSRPRLDVTITGESNQALSANIVGDHLIVTPPGPNCNCQTLFTFTLDDGINAPQIETLLFRFERDLAGTVPVGFPQSPVGRIFLPPGFEPFLINLADLAAGGQAAFAENVTVSNVQLPVDGSNNPDNSRITATVFNATHYQIAPGTNDLVGFEIITFDVRFTEDPVDVTVFTQYRLEFADAPAAQQGPDTTPPTVTLSSEDVDEGGVTDEDTITLIAEFNEPINAATFTRSDVTVTGDSDHEVDRVQLLSELRYEIDIGHDDEDPNIAVSIASGTFDDLNENTNTAASNTFRYGFQFDLPVDTTPPTIILPIIPAQHAVNEAISLQFGLVSGVAADYTLDGAPASAAISTGGAFTWTPAATGNFEFDVVATGTGGTDIEPVTLRIVNTVRPFTQDNTLVSDQIFENTTVVNPTSVDFSNNGTLMFITEFDDGDITQYSTSGTPFDFGNTTSDINSAIVRGPVTVIPNADSSDVAFSNDGRTMIVLGTPRTLYEYSLDSPYDVASLSEVHTYRISGISGGITGFTISSDGTKLFVLGGGVSDVTAYEYDLGIPFSISDVTLIGNSGVLRDAEPRAITFPHDIAFRSDGTAMFVIEQFSATFHEYALSTPFSIASVTHQGNFTVHPQTGNVRSLSLSSDDQRAFTLSISRGNVYGFTLPDLILPTVQITSTTAEGATAGGRAAFTAVFSEDVTGLLENEITVDSSDNVARLASSFVMINGTHYSFEVLRGTADATVTVSIPRGAAQSATNFDNIISNTYSVNLEFLAPQFDYSLVFPPHTETYTRPLDLAFSENGKRLFILETGGIGEDRVIMHNLATAFDISTRFDNIADTFNVNGESAPTGLEFSEDGRSMFISGTQQDRVQVFEIGNTGTAFTLSDFAPGVDFPLGSTLPDTTPDGLDFSDDGLHMYITGNQNNRIYGYTLGMAFDLTSITEPAVVSSALGTNNPMDSIINADGSILYVLSGQGVNGFRSLHVYSLGTAYDVSDLTLIGERHPLTTATVTGMVLSPDSNTLYVTERSTDRILEFTLNTTPPVLDAVNFAFTEDDDVSAHQIPGSDVDGTALTYRISDNPSWLTINSTGGLVGIVPQDNTDLYRPEDTPARCTDQGSVSFTVTVSDDGFDSDTMDDVERTYTVGVFNSERLNNVLPVNVDNVGVPLAINAVQLDLSVYTNDDPEDTLTYAVSGVTGNAITPGSFAVDSDTGILTFMSTGNEDGTATIDYIVCDGSDFATLQVTTVADVADTFVMFTDFTLREPLGHGFVVSIAEFDRHRVIEAPYGELIEYVNEWDDPLPFNGENTIQVDFDNPVPNEIPFAQRFVIATNEDGQNFVGEFTSRFTVNLRATADSIRDDPATALAIDDGQPAEAGDIIESATATVTFVSFGPTIDASFDVFAPGDDVTIEFPIMPANLNYDIRLSAEALEMIETLGLETGDITNQNPANLALSGTIPDDILPAEVASMDYMIPYGVHLVPGESTIAFPAELNIRIGDMLTIPTAELLREGFVIDLVQLGTPRNATFTPTSYMIVFTDVPPLLALGTDATVEMTPSERQLVQADPEHTCADLAEMTATATVTTTGMIDGMSENIVTTAMFTFGECPSSGGDDDSQWKTKPTFGKSYTTGEKLVNCGYSMDGTCRDVTDYHVDYQRETITTDSYHDFALKTYAQNGLRSFNIGFGLPGIGSPLNSAEAQINVNLARDYSLDSTYKIVSVEYSNENNVIGEDATFEISRVKCLPTDENNLCVQLNIDGVLFRETLYDEPFAINAIDSKRRGTTHFMNEGLLVSGDSLNIPPTHELSERHSNQGDAVKLHLTRTDKLADVWTDQFGHQWTKNAFGTWSYVDAPPIDMSSACTDEDKRVCDAFAEKRDAHMRQMEELRDSTYGRAYVTNDGQQ